MATTGGYFLSEFNDFTEGTGPTYVTGPDSLVNEAVNNTYYLGRMMQGDVNATKTIQGGADIRESIVFRDNGTFEFYPPGASHSWKNPQRLQKIRAYWRFSMAHMSWLDQEILLNDKIGYGTEEVRFQQYVDLRNEKEMLMWTAKWNGMESALWAEPDKALMEGEGDGFLNPYSVPAFINADTDGLFARQASGTWTTVEGIDPTATATAGRFTPQILTYDSATLNDDGNPLSMFSELWQDVMFEQPSMHKQYWENPTLNKQMILTTKVGVKAIEVLLRGGNTGGYVAGAQDAAYADPLYRGIPVARVSQLESATLYNDGAAGNTTEALADLKGPRFYMMNGNYLYPVFHRDRYFTKQEVTRSHDVPDTWVCPVATWYNVICTSRQRQGILSPSADLYYA